MRRAIVGTLGLTLTAGFLVALGTTAQAQPDDGHSPSTKPAAATADNLPNPLEDKRRELRQTAISDVLSGRRDTTEKNGSTVVKVGEENAPLTAAQRSRAKAGKSVKQRKTDQYVELQREKTDKIFVVLAEFGNERHPSYPDQDTDPATPGPATFDGPLHNAIAEPDRTKDNSTVWQADYIRTTSRTCTSARATASSRSRPTTRSSPPAATRSTARSPTGSRSSTTRPATAAQRLPRAAAPSAPTSGTWSATPSTRGSPTSSAAGRTAAQIKADLASSTSGTATTTTATATSTSPTATSTTSRSCTPAGTRPTATVAGRGRHLGPPLVRLRQPRRSDRPGRQQARRHPDRRHRHLGRRLHDRSRRTADFGLRPRVRPRPRPARPLRHQRRRQRVGLVDPDVAEPRCRPRTTRGSAPARRHSAWDKLQLGWLDYEIATAGDKRTLRARPARVQHQERAGPVVVLPKKKSPPTW